MRKISIHNMALVGFILILAVIVQINYPLFLSPLNLKTLALGFLFEGIIALGMTFAIITGGIDLSVASIWPFAGIISAKLVNVGTPVVLVIVLTLGLCALIGFINAWLIKVLKTHPMIVTLAMMLTLRGFNLSLTEGKSISGFPDTFKNLAEGSFFGINFPIVIFVLLSLLLGYLLNNHKYFRQLYFIGKNEKAAQLSGINTHRIKAMAYVLCSVLAGLAGILASAKYGAAHWSHGNLSELKAISAVAIGGASLYGGSGRIGSTVIGTLFLAVVFNAFVMAGINTFWFDVVNGTLLIIAISFSHFIDYQNSQIVLRIKHQKIIGGGPSK